MHAGRGYIGKTLVLVLTLTMVMKPRNRLPVSYRACCETAGAICLTRCRVVTILPSPTQVESCVRPSHALQGRAVCGPSLSVASLCGVFSAIVTPATAMCTSSLCACDSTTEVAVSHGIRRLAL